MFECRHRPNGLDLAMAAQFDAVEVADATVSSYLAEAHVPVELFAVRIMLREALLNAVQHGSGERAEMTVRCRLDVEERGVRLVVEDDGPGFVWHDRSAELDILGDGGRGIPLMQIYATEMHYNERGNRVELRRAFETVPQGCRNEDK